MILQFPHNTTVWAWLKTVVIWKHPGHLISIKNEFGDCTSLFSLWVRFSDSADGFSRSTGMMEIDGCWLVNVKIWANKWDKPMKTQMWEHAVKLSKFLSAGFTIAARLEGSECVEAEAELNCCGGSNFVAREKGAGSYVELVLPILSSLENTLRCSPHCSCPSPLSFRRLGVPSNRLTLAMAESSSWSR